VCHSDSVTVQGLLPGTTYPWVPGLEVIGMVEAIGPDVAGWDVGMRVGVSVGSLVRAGTAPAAAAVNRNAYPNAAKSVVAQ
jgi:D-arabinose 1-dehydrogenase-like Zn-dependent alcohol dehydrogenase